MKDKDNIFASHLSAFNKRVSYVFPEISSKLQAHNSHGRKLSLPVKIETQVRLERAVKPTSDGLTAAQRNLLFN